MWWLCGYWESILILWSVMGTEFASCRCSFDLTRWWCMRYQLLWFAMSSFLFWGSGSHLCSVWYPGSSWNLTFTRIIVLHCRVPIILPNIIFQFSSRRWSFTPWGMFGKKDFQGSVFGVVVICWCLVQLRSFSMENILHQKGKNDFPHLWVEIIFLNYLSFNFIFIASTSSWIFLLLLLLSSINRFYQNTVQFAGTIVDISYLALVHKKIYFFLKINLKQCSVIRWTSCRNIWRWIKFWGSGVDNIFKWTVFSTKKISTVFQVIHNSSKPNSISKYPLLHFFLNILHFCNITFLTSKCLCCGSIHL